MTDVNLSTLHFNYHREGYYNTLISCQIAHEYPSLAMLPLHMTHLAGDRSPNMSQKLPPHRFRQPRMPRIPPISDSQFAVLNV